MADVIFCRTRYPYDSYGDLWRLIQVSGYPLIYADEIDPQSDNTYILTVINGETDNGWAGARARIILYDMEWRLDGAYPTIPGVTERWAADRWYAEKIGAKYVLLGSHPQLNLQADAERPQKDYDFTMMSYMTYRRQWIRDRLLEQRLRISPQGWGESRHLSLSKSYLMLHVHQNDNIPTIAPQRFALAAAYHLPMISETVAEPDVLADVVAWYDYDDLVEATYRNHRRLYGLGEALHQRLCIDLPFRKNIEAAV